MFDAVFCITLEGQEERQKYMSNIFKAIRPQIKSEPEMYVAKRHPRGGLVGCFSSHIEVCKIALQRGVTNVLIFEDDIVITSGYDQEIFDDVNKFMKDNDDWECIQFGYGPALSKSFLNFGRLLVAPRVSKHLVKYFGLHTHANCLSRKGLEKIVKFGYQELEKNDIKHYDQWLYDILDMNATYGVVPMIFDQYWCFQTTNSYKNIIEKLYRPLACFYMQTQFYYKWSLLRYYRTSLIIITCIILTIIILFVNNHMKSHVKSYKISKKII